MTVHDDILLAAAESIDFPTTPPERRRIEAHLADCAECTRRVAALRADAALIAALPVPVLPERRQAEILSSVLRPPAQMNPLRLVALAALLTLAVLGSLVAGAELLRRTQGELAVVPQPSSSPTPTDEPEATPASSVEPPSTPEPGQTPNVSIGRAWEAAPVAAAAPNRPTGTIHDVAPVGQGFVAVGRGCAGDSFTCEATVWTSDDGSSWERSPASEATDIGGRISTSGSTVDGMTGVAVGAPGIVAIGSDAQLIEWEAMSWLSEDGGATWSRSPVEQDRAAPGPTGLNFPRLNGVVWTGEQFVVVGEDWSDWDGDLATLARSRSRAGAWTSADGRTWTQVPDSEAFDTGGFLDTGEEPVAGGMTQVVAGPRGLVAVGRTCPPGASTCEPAAWTSSDGVAWQRAAGMPAIRGTIDSVAASDEGYVAVGSACEERPARCTALVLMSPDGQAWTQHTVGDTDRLESVTRIGDQFVAVAPNANARLWNSPDGVTWNEVATGPAQSDDEVDWQFAANDNAAVSVASSDGSGGPQAWVSR
jgi:hypothetical protein